MLINELQIASVNYNGRCEMTIKHSPKIEEQKYRGKIIFS